MKKFLLLVGLASLSPKQSQESLPPPLPSLPPYIQPISKMEPKQVQQVPQIDLIDALIYVESRGNEKAYAPSENAAGCLQIRPIMVMEVNRILKKINRKNRYTLEDRWDCKKSKEMFYIWQNFHHPNSSAEMIARNWNGGGNGYKIKATEKYWKKVQLKLNNDGKN